MWSSKLFGHFTFGIIFFCSSLSFECIGIFNSCLYFLLLINCLYWLFELINSHKNSISWVNVIVKRMRKNLMMNGCEKIRKNRRECKRATNFRMQIVLCETHWVFIDKSEHIVRTERVFIFDAKLNLIELNIVEWTQYSKIELLESAVDCWAI